MPDRKNPHIIYTDSSVRPSRFLVDLNKSNAELIKSYSQKKKFLVLSKLINLKQLRKYSLKLFFYNILRFSKSFGRAGGMEASRQIISPDIKINNENKQRNFADKNRERQDDKFLLILINKLKKYLNIYDERLKRLAFYPFIAILVKILYKLIIILYRTAYYLGFLTVWLIKFIFLLSGSMVKLFVLPVFSRVSRQIRPELKPGDKPTAIGNEPTSVISPPAASEVSMARGEESLAEATETINNKLSGMVEKQNTAEAEVRSEPAPSEPRLEEEAISRNLVSKFNWPLKPAIYFGIFLFIFILPFKALTYYYSLSSLQGQVLGISEAAINDMFKASESAASFDFVKASQNFSQAGVSFKQAREEVKEISAVLDLFAKAIPNEKIKLGANADNIFMAGSLSAKIGEELSLAASDLADQGDRLDIKLLVNGFLEHSRLAYDYSRDLEQEINMINTSDLPDEYQPKFKSLRDQTTTFIGSLEEINNILTMTRAILGFDMDKRYLFVFQNNAELRASGGFIGSFALVDFRDGKIKNIEAPSGGSYDTDGGLREKIASPAPLQLINAQWHFWDANWWPDWPTSARKLMWFYEKSAGPTVDGVISLTPTVMERVLGIIGGIDMADEYGAVIDAANFWEVVQTYAEQKPEDHPDYFPNPYLPAAAATSAAAADAGANIGPKKIIDDLLTKIINEAPGRLDGKVLLRLFSAVEQLLKEKHILLYFNDTESARTVDKLGWDGRQVAAGWDYLMVVNTNIGGGKSDRVISEEISHTAEVGPDGVITDTVVIKRIHHGRKGERFTGARNVNWLRIYVPLGSKLISARGWRAPEQEYFEPPKPGWQEDSEVAKSEAGAIIDEASGTTIYNENNKTVFANWSMIDPGETAIIVIKYKLPFKLTVAEKPASWSERLAFLWSEDEQPLIPYALAVQKQPGSIGSEFSSRLLLPPNLPVVWKYPADLDALVNGWDFSDTLATDIYSAVILAAGN